MRRAIGLTLILVLVACAPAGYPGGDRLDPALGPRAGTMNVLLQQLLGLGAPPFNIYSLGGMIRVLALGSVSTSPGCWSRAGGAASARSSRSGPVRLARGSTDW